MARCRPNAIKSLLDLNIGGIEMHEMTEMKQFDSLTQISIK